MTYCDLAPTFVFSVSPSRLHLSGHSGNHKLYWVDDWRRFVSFLVRQRVALVFGIINSKCPIQNHIMDILGSALTSPTVSWAMNRNVTPKRSKYSKSKEETSDDQPDTSEKFKRYQSTGMSV